MDYSKNTKQPFRQESGTRERQKNSSSNRRFMTEEEQVEQIRQEETVFLQNAGFQENWITIGADKDLPTFAECMGKRMGERNLTSSKIRSIYGEMKRVQMGNFEKEKSSFYLLRPKVAYALGRDKKNAGLTLFKLVFDKAFPFVTDYSSYQNFCQFMEAILAYHKYYKRVND